MAQWNDDGHYGTYPLRPCQACNLDRIFIPGEPDRIRCGCGTHLLDEADLQAVAARDKHICEYILPESMWFKEPDTADPKRAKFFYTLGVVFGAAAIGCLLIVVLQFVRGFFNPRQWLYMIGGLLGYSVFKSMAYRYRDTSRQYME